MGIPTLSAFLRRRQCSTAFQNNNNDNDETVEFLSIDTILFDVNTILHKLCYKLLAENEDDIFSFLPDVKKLIILEICEIVNVILTKIIKKNIELDIFLAVDGVSPPGKRYLQRVRRSKSINPWHNHLTAGSNFLKHLFDNAFRKDCIFNIEQIIKKHNTNNGDTQVKRVFLTLDNDQQPNEGEIKCIKFLEKKNSQDCIFVSTDNDVIATSFLLIQRNIFVLTMTRVNELQEKKILFHNQKIKSLLFKNDDLLSQCYGFLLFAVFGGDYLPPFLPSASLIQMELVSDLVNDFKEKLYKNIKNFSLMFTNIIVLGHVIKLTLESFKFLTKHRRCTHHIENYSIQLQIEILEKFFSDLLWVYGHYSNNDNICPNRNKFLIETDLGRKSFFAIKNDTFKNCDIINKLNIDKILVNVLSTSCSVDSTWLDVNFFRDSIITCDVK